MIDMPIFKVEEFWKKYEFSAPYLFCASDTESWYLKDILAMAEPETKELWEQLVLGYTETQGLPLLREEIARTYSNIDCDQILTTAGAEEGIYCAMRALLSPGDHVIVLSPCYQSLETIPQVLGADVTCIPLQFEEQWKIDLNKIKAAWRDSTKLIVLNCPHNPTGTLIDREVYEKLIALARKNGAYIFCDEVYRFLELDEDKRLPSIADAYEKGISLNVMTKSFGLAGLRIGWLASRDMTFFKKVASYKMYTSICNSAPSEILAVIALRSKEKLLRRNRDIALHNFKLLKEFVERHPHSISWVAPEGGTMAFLKLLLPLSIEEFMEQLVTESGVLIMPGSLFDITGNFFRVGFGRKNMPDVLDRFEEFLDRIENKYNLN